MVPSYRLLVLFFLCVFKGGKMLKKLLGDKYNIIKNEDNLEEKANQLVNILFVNKLDKGRKPYIDHLLFIKNNVNTDNQKIIGLLHDIIETLKISKGELEEIGFPKNITEVIDILTRKDNPKEDYDEYIKRIIESNNIDALEVKLVDLKHNMDISQIENPSVKDFSRIEKRYRPNYIKIQNKLNERK